MSSKALLGNNTPIISSCFFFSRYPNAKVINFGTWFIFSFPIAIIMLVLTWLWLHFLFLGCKWVTDTWTPCAAALVTLLKAQLCLFQLQGDVLAQQEAQDQEGDNVREEDPGGVRQAGANQVSQSVFRPQQICLPLDETFNPDARVTAAHQFSAVSVSQLPRGDHRHFLHLDDSPVVHPRARLCARLDFAVWKVSLNLSTWKSARLCLFYFDFYLFYKLFSLLRKGYRTDATVSVLLGFLLFLLPARRPFSSSNGKKSGRCGEADFSEVHISVCGGWSPWQEGISEIYCHHPLFSRGPQVANTVTLKICKYNTGASQ